ncbi:MAG: hypothetical protein ABEJ72_04960 [Candidatus Aenigmatarchaeota archaeon]
MAAARLESLLKKIGLGAGKGIAGLFANLIILIGILALVNFGLTKNPQTLKYGLGGLIGGVVLKGILREL